MYLTLLLLIQSLAEGFIRNATEGKADLFAPHSGTLNGSWQFQQHIFESLVNLVLNENILSKQKLIDVFNSGLKSKEGKSALEKFNNKNKSKLRNLSSFKGDPKELVTLLDIENNYSPELRKILNQKIASDKTFQKAIGVKNITEFHNRMTDPLNKGVVGGEIMSFIEFDPTTFEVAKTNPKDVDHHPSFGWVVRAKIKRIMQPNKFFKSYDVTSTYTKYNTDKTVLSRKTEDNFAQSNVLSSAGAIPKVAKVSVPTTRQQQAQDDFTIQDVIKDAEQEGCFTPRSRRLWDISCPKPPRKGIGRYRSGPLQQVRCSVVYRQDRGGVKACVSSRPFWIILDN